ncbi:MAG: N-6 DNA methylase [Deltaproteobacteria bacterium]|nr:N-6 DNA methylase [Deltaproteobacteria bacterium]
METKNREVFASIHTEGGLLPSNFILKIAKADSEIEGLKPTNYDLIEGIRLNEEISDSWNRIRKAWVAFKRSIEDIPEDNSLTSDTRQKWLLHLFNALGYGSQLPKFQNDDVEGDYKLSHQWEKTPIHLMGWNISLDHRTKGVPGASRMSPHSLLQEFLNRSQKSLWGFLSNGRIFRILRNNTSITRQSFIEFDLELMMDGEIYSDFSVLWLLTHQSRVAGENHFDCWLEKWRIQSADLGTRALDVLRGGVETALTELGIGFLKETQNIELLKSIESGTYSKENLYKELLRLIYRLIFLLVAEERDLLLIGDEVSKTRYKKYYSINRIKELSRNYKGTHHCDLWQNVLLIFNSLESDQGCSELALPALGSMLWSNKAIPSFVNTKISNQALLKAFHALCFIKNENVLTSIDFKNLGAEELGSVYESLLELQPEMQLTTKQFSLKHAAGHERKTTGSYYTPTELIQSLIETALDPVVKRAMKAEDPIEALLAIKVCDPACGSGHFLIAAAHRIAKQVAVVESGELEPAPFAIRSALRRVIGRCIYGVDMNSMAVELCKVSLWLETLQPGKPLSFLDHHIQCGNSLLGTTPELLANGIPNEAFNAILGDDKNVCSGLKATNKTFLAAFEQTSQTSHQLSFLSDSGKVIDLKLEVSNSIIQALSQDDDSIEIVKEKEKNYIDWKKSTDYQSQLLLADAWCSAFVWRKTENSKPITSQTLKDIENSSDNIDDNQKTAINDLKKQFSFFHWYLAFPEIFQKQLEFKGFDVVLSNPPWDTFEFKEKEWFAFKNQNIAEASNQSQRRKLITKLETENQILFKSYLEAKRNLEATSHFIRNCQRYPLCARGKMDSYAIFAELNKQLINGKGYTGTILPSGIATADNTKFFFQEIINKKQLRSFFDFENRKKIFKIDSRIKFALMTIARNESNKDKKIDFVFFALKVKDLFDESRKFNLAPEDIKSLNPNTFTCPIFRNSNEANIAKQVYKRIPILIQESDNQKNIWNIRLSSMFNMSSSSHLFKNSNQLSSDDYILKGNVYEKGNKRFLPLYEAKMLHHYNHRWATYVDGNSNLTTEIQLKDKGFCIQPQYWISELEVNYRASNVPNDLIKNFKEKNVRKVAECLFSWFFGFFLNDSSVKKGELLLSDFYQHVFKNPLQIIQQEDKCRKLENEYPLSLEEIM